MTAIPIDVRKLCDTIAKRIRRGVARHKDDSVTLDRLAKRPAGWRA
jgi:hypothetical protein